MSVPDFHLQQLYKRNHEAHYDKARTPSPNPAANGESKARRIMQAQ
jgi:hypothetical protein